MKFFHSHAHDLGPEAVAKEHKFTHRVWRDPYVDWVIIIVISVLLAGILSTLGIRTYLNIEKSMSDAASRAVTSAPASIDTRSLTKVLERFEMRDAERANLIRGYQGPSDPSI